MGLLGYKGLEYLGTLHLTGELKILHTPLLACSGRMVLQQIIIWYVALSPSQKAFNIFEESITSKSFTCVIILAFLLTVLWWNKFWKIRFNFFNNCMTLPLTNMFRHIESLSALTCSLCV